MLKLHTLLVYSMSDKPSKTLVLYIYHEVNDRVKRFIDTSIFYDTSIDFIIISNNKSNTINVPNYVKTIFRDNVGYDFGGWSEALLINDLYKNYDTFIFVNSSVIGPYIPSYCKEKWTSIYLNGLRDNIKLFGSTINTCLIPKNLAHVQSYIFSMDKTTLEYLIRCEIFSLTNQAKTFGEAIYQKEILMSRKIVENGWNIGSLLSCYTNVDFTFSTKEPHDYSNLWYDDICYPQYRNLWNEYQLVFIKGNRKLI